VGEGPPIDFFSANTAAFVHELPADSLSNARGDTNYIRIEVLTPVGIPIEGAAEAWSTCESA
jgi:hypothetical protein